MKSTFILAILCGIIALSSCSNGGNTPVPIPARADTVSKGDSLQFSFSTDTPRTFNISDLVIRQSPVYAMTGSVYYNGTDSLFHVKIQVIDYKMQQMALYLEAANNALTGLFTVVKNSSTFTDYTRGQNLTYSVALGSTVNVTSASYPIRGSFNLYIYHNHDSIPASGTFKIYY